MTAASPTNIFSAISLTDAQGSSGSLAWGRVNSISTSRCFTVRLGGFVGRSVVAIGSLLDIPRKHKLVSPTRISSP